MSTIRSGEWLDKRRQNQAMKLAYSECSGEDNVVEVASVDEEGARDLVKTVVRIKRSRNRKGYGSVRLTGVGNLR